MVGKLGIGNEAVVANCWKPHDGVKSHCQHVQGRVYGGVIDHDRQPEDQQRQQRPQLSNPESLA